MVYLWLLGQAECQVWATDRATEYLTDVMRDGTGNSAVSEQYHLQYFGPIKIPVLCSGDLKLLEVTERNYIHRYNIDMVL